MDELFVKNKKQSEDTPPSKKDSLKKILLFLRIHNIYEGDAKMLEHFFSGVEHSG